MTTSEVDIKYLEIPDKSENDMKHYKTLVLTNGLHALLISDPDQDVVSCGKEFYNSENHTWSSKEEVVDSEIELEEDFKKLAAVALLVDVGFFAEPLEYQGLAHFLEHMLFMGSEKYPKENFFDPYIKKCGGLNDAFTECEETFFNFEVPDVHLCNCLDIFSSLLKEPILRQESMARELENVESEFQRILFNTEARRKQLLASLANKLYPHSMFSIGNLESLKNGIKETDLHKGLNAFYKRHYSAHRMYLCIQSNFSIDVLETLVLRHFSDIPSNNLKGKVFSVYNYRQAFIKEFHSEVFFVKPIENVCKLELTWVLPPMMKLYKCKPDNFISYLIGYEGEGSLCAYLRKKLWALELIAGVDESGYDTNSIYTLFNLSIYLTESGFQHLDEVLGATFAYIQLFSQCGSLKDAYEELSRIKANGFRFAYEQLAFDNVQKLVLRFKNYPPKDILTATESYYEFDEEQVLNVIKHLNEFSFNIMITSQQKYGDIKYDKKEKWFGTEYATIKMPQKWQDLWNNCKLIPELFLPKPNRFLAQDFHLYWVENGKPEIPKVPKKLLQTNICELWFRQDDKFQLPDAFMYFYFVSPLPRQSAKNKVLCDLYAQLVQYRVTMVAYPATVAGLNYNMFCFEKGVVLQVNGFNEKLHLVVELVTKAMSSLHGDITEEQLEVFIKHQRQAYFNTLIKPKDLNKDIRLGIVENIRWPLIDKYKCLNDIRLQDMLDFAEKYTKELYVQSLMQGNLTEESAHNVMNSVLTTLNCQSIVETKYIENRTIQLPLGAHYIRCHALNDKDCNTVITNFYQIGPFSVAIKSILDLLMIYIEPPLYYSLSTKQKLGYVNSSVRINNGIAGYSITVNSNETKHSAAHVEKSIEAFRKKILRMVDNTDCTDFQDVRNALIKAKQVVDVSLHEEVSRNWEEIINEEYIFDRNQKEIQILRKVRLKDMLDFCRNIERTSLRKLSIQVIGHTVEKTNENLLSDEIKTENNETDNDNIFNALANNLDLKFISRADDFNTIADIKEFKKNLLVYPVTKTKIIDENDEDQSSPTGSVEIIETSYIL